jgi:hypothetical protein
MKRKIIQSILLFLIIFSCNKYYSKDTRQPDRQYWINMLTKIADPVLNNLSKEKLHLKMPVEVNEEGKKQKREVVTHLEAFGRLIAGMAPWLELGVDSTNEGKLRKKYINLSVKCLSIAVNPNSPDFMNFNKDSKQPLVDAAFLAHALIRAPKSLWGNLDDQSRKNLIAALKSTRIIKPGENNWLLFSAMIEAALLKFDGSCEIERIEYAVKKHLEWYKGDGVYGDGTDFHWDYYNSFVIQPMLLDVLKLCKENNVELGNNFDLCVSHAQRYAEIQERLISPEGSFPAIGRSLAYRVGAFQLLEQISLWKKLNDNIKPAQVRSALTAVIKRVMMAPDTFDKNGWLQIGFYGHQLDIAEGYISTGSLYLCSVGFIALGLPSNDEFWTRPKTEWTAKKIWSGKNMKADHALKD